MNIDLAHISNNLKFFPNKKNSKQAMQFDPLKSKIKFSRIDCKIGLNKVQESWENKKSVHLLFCIIKFSFSITRDISIEENILCKQKNVTNLLTTFSTRDFFVQF